MALIGKVRINSMKMRRNLILKHLRFEAADPAAPHHPEYPGIFYENILNQYLKKNFFQSHLDTSNFDEYPMDQDGAPPDDVSGWDEQF